ncbi:A/G-specific adenine glycosylase [Acidicapsa dinghuensis]|uniref:Adenine DNA glycosylase n=1 Tax=Acidicapsa dinghuensis TaxID=2218256 RepID=A0ABW1EEH8_9BACT|nr:A/G-specific adenine glycosylase [Acidicapsa dinghuensis]
MAPVKEARIDLKPEDTAQMRAKLLDWYRRHLRDLPWRRTRDPYAIWVSEIMLQQTRVAAVVERYEQFLKNFPTVVALAHAAEADVLALWSGLGYYRRARMMHKAAKTVVEQFGGVMPASAAALRDLPGIGVYTSAAIASIAYGEPVAVVDGNVERVVQRLAGWGSESREGQAELNRKIADYATRLLDPTAPGDFNQAMMELGATMCLPKAPLCLACPLREHCKTQGEHPAPTRARMRSETAAYALVIRSQARYREILLEQRSEAETVMPGMWELPALADKEFDERHQRMAVRHAIMQVNYYVRIRTAFEDDAELLALPSGQHKWIRLRDVLGLPLTGLARKVLLRADIPELAAVPPMLPARASAG